MLYIKIIFCPAIIAAIVTFAVRMGRRKQIPDFLRWWKTEGWPIFMGIWVIFVVAYFLAAK
jgi:hypothetical protein